MIRRSKILCILAIAFYCFLDVFNNITDYYVNFYAVEQALMMKDIFPNSLIFYRAITNPFLHHAAYLIIIGFETLSMFVCFIGAWKLFRALPERAEIFNDSKKWAVAGLTLGFLTWQVLFMSIGGSWFGLWMSSLLKESITAAFQIFITFLMILIYVIIKDE